MDFLDKDLYNNTKEPLVKSEENLTDGDLDSLTVDVYQSNEDLNFINAFEAVSNKNTADKIKMMKKIKESYKIGNPALNYSIESYCDEEIQSTEGAGEKIKETFIAIFKKIAEFVNHLIDVIANMKYRGLTAEDIKYCLKEIHKQTMDNIKKLSNISELNDDDKKVLELKRKMLDSSRNACLHLLQCYSIANKYAKKAKINIGNSVPPIPGLINTDINTDILKKIDPDLNKISFEFALVSGLTKKVNKGEIRPIAIKIVLGEFNYDVKTLCDYDVKILKCKENLQKKLEELNNKK